MKELRLPARFYCVFLLAGLLTTIASGPSAAEEDVKDSITPASSSLEKAIRASEEKFAQAFQKGDPEAVAAFFTTDSDYTDDTGRTYQGREEIQEGFSRFFSNNPGATLQIAPLSVRKLGKDAALEEGISTVTLPNGMSTAGPFRAIYVKQGRHWRMASIQESADSSAVASNHLQDLDWLVGKWTAKGNNREMDTSFRWMGNGRFLQRLYTVREGDRVISTGMQIIGWDPAIDQIASWTFDSSGSYGHGRWEPRPEGWMAAQNGLTPNGAHTSSTDLLMRADDNRLIWESTNRILQGVPQPDRQPITIVRVQEKE